MSSGAEFSVNSVGWFILEGFPWWPVYLCDAKSLRTKLYYLGDEHAKILKKARDYSNDYVLVYFFGSHQFSLARTRRGVLKPWGCSDQSTLCKGHPKHLAKRGNQIEELKMAIIEVEDFLSQPKDCRLPPHFVPSDLNLALTPPPPKGPSEEDMDDDEDEEMYDDDNEERDDETEKEDEEEDEPEDKEKTPTKLRAQNEKAEKDIHSSGKRKRKANEKGSNFMEKIELKKPKERKETKGLTREQTVTEPIEKASSDVVPSDDLKKMKVSEKKVSCRPPDSSNDATMLSDKVLSEKLEIEIRWILNNCEFEEMTTKTVRRLLQQRLNMNLRSHKGIIKEVVTKVIAAMEEEDDETDPSTLQPNTTDSKCQPQASIESLLKHQSINSETKQIDQTDAKSTKSEHSPKKVKLISEADLLEAKAKLSDPNLSHEQILECLEALTSVKYPDSSTLYLKLISYTKMPLTIQLLKKTGISRSVSSLRQHANDKVSASASALRTRWMKLLKADDEQQNDPKMKTAQCHSNQLPQEGSHNSQLSKLIEMVETLQDQVEYKDQVATKPTRIVHEKQLRVLHDLYQMRLSTKEIIESKVGMAVSRLRKSGNEAIVKAASKLRRKWKTEAEAA